MICTLKSIGICSLYRVRLKIAIACSSGVSRKLLQTAIFIAHQNNNDHEILSYLKTQLQLLTEVLNLLSFHYYERLWLTKILKTKKVI